MRKKFTWIKIFSISIVVAILVILASLLLPKDPDVPKPYGYSRIILPKHEYKLLPDTLPYRFEVSKYANVLKSDSPHPEKHWINIAYPDFQAAIQITYKPVHNNQQLLREYLQDAYQLTTKHQIRADAIEEYLVYTPQGHTAIVAALKGQVPSQYQFYITDSIHHFLRGALYFHTASENDSLAPVIDFIKEDIMHILYTLSWKDNPK
jgi:gliding motility-associated lipoprotein GldD